MNCSEMLYSSWNHHQCINPAKYGDKCGVHDPGKIAERKAKRGPTEYDKQCARWDAEAKELASLQQDKRILDWIEEYSRTAIEIVEDWELFVEKVPPHKRGNCPDLRTYMMQRAPELKHED